MFLCCSFFCRAQTTINTPTIVFKVPLGKTIEKGGISFTLSEIIEDSRCPTDATCVWAGRAKVLVTVIHENGITEEIVVLFEKGNQPKLATTKTTCFKATALNPYPSLSTKEKTTYNLLISECAVNAEN